MHTTHARHGAPGEPHSHGSHAPHGGRHGHSGPWSESLPARAKADLADPAGSLDPSDHPWSQWRSPALIARGPGDAARWVLDAVGPAAVGPAGRDVLEVGCGSGYLALHLARAGHRVTAVDPGPEGIDLGRRTLALCRQAGEAVDVRYQEAEFLEWDDGGVTFDALVFNLSLHHIEDLEGALDKAVRLLRPAGRIVVNDYAFDRLEGRTAAWVADLEAVMGLAAGASDVPDPASARKALAEKVAETASNHGLHGFERLIAGLGARFRQDHFSWEPYLYTRVANRAPALPADRQERLVAFLADLERLQIDQGAIDAVCYRFVGVPSN